MTFIEKTTTSLATVIRINRGGISFFYWKMARIQHPTTVLLHFSRLFHSKFPNFQSSEVHRRSQGRGSSNQGHPTDPEPIPGEERHLLRYYVNPTIEEVPLI